MIRPRPLLLLAVVLLSSLRSFAQLGPLNWTGPMKVEANEMFMLWHDDPNTQIHNAGQKIYGFDLHGDTLPPESRITRTTTQFDDREGHATFTDVANGKFTTGPRDNVVAIWGPGPDGISLMIPVFDTTAAMWTTTVQDNIVGDIQNDRIYVKTLDLDGDSLDEFIVAYLDNNDSIRFNLYDVDSLLHPTLMASYCDRKAPDHVQGRVRYYIETGDFNGDGDDELALALHTGFDGSYLVVIVQLYDFNGSTLEPRATEEIWTSYSAPLDEFELAATAGDFIADAKDELVITMVLGHGPGANYRNAHIQVIEAAPDLMSIEQGSYFTPDIPSSTALRLATAAGDLLGDARDEIVMATGRRINVCTMTTGDSLAMLPSFIAAPNNVFGTESARAMYDFVQVTDVDQNGSLDIVTAFDLLGNSNAGFCTSIYTVDTVGLTDPLDAEFVLRASRMGDEAHADQGTDPPQYSFRPYAMVVGNYDGLNFTIGEPTHYVAQDVTQPVVILNAPPVHFDVLNSVAHDLNNCYNGAACDFGSTYRKQTTTSIEVTTTVQSDWVVSLGMSATGSTEAGVGVTVSKNYENHFLLNFGLHFSNTDAQSTTIAIGVEVTAKEDDRIYSTVTEYDVWEYPLYHGNELFARSTFLAFVPRNVSATWFPSKSYNAVNLVPDHEVANVLSYPAYLEFDDNPNFEEAIVADYNSDSFVLDASSSYDWFVQMDDFQSTNASTTVEGGVDIGFGIGLFRFDGDFGGKKITTHRTTITEEIDLKVHLGSVNMGVGDAKYTVTPYAYWDRIGALVVDYAAKPELAPPGFPQTWWQIEYGQLPDPTFILPWKLDPEKGFAISEPAKREQSKDIILSPMHPIPGDTVTITARVRNFSLQGTPEPVSVSFYLGDPDAGGTPLIGLSGTNTVSTTGPIPPQGRQDVQLQWVIPGSQTNYPRIYAVLDEGGSITEIHEQNNKGFNVLGWNSGPVGVPEDPWGTEGYALGQCRPNPFTSETFIDYNLPTAGRTTITVFDQVGREVTTLMDGPRSAGTHTITFDGSQLPAGIYYCSMRAGAYYDVRKMVLTR